MEWLSRLVSSEEESRRLSGLCIARNSPSISHLFFTDDILIFCQTNLEEVENLIDVLQTFQAVCGQTISHLKSAATFLHDFNQS